MGSLFPVKLSMIKGVEDFSLPFLIRLIPTTF